jgi:flagellar protein FliS
MTSTSNGPMDDDEGNGVPMTITTTMHDRYRTNAVETMSPGRLVVALYDRLVLDLHRASAAIAQHDHRASHEALVHAQAIVAELHDSLDTSRWAPAQGLADLYRYLDARLVRANLAKDAGIVEECLRIVDPLRSAWSEAAGVVPSSGATAAG